MGDRPVSVAVLLGRGFLRRCPVCGQGGLFHRWFTIAECCPRCGLRFERIEGHWLGALGINTIVTFVALFVVVVVGLGLSYPDFDSTGVVLLAGVGTAVVVPLLFFGSARTLWTAVDLCMRPLAPGEARVEEP